MKTKKALLGLIPVLILAAVIIGAVQPKVIFGDRAPEPFLPSLETGSSMEAVASNYLAVADRAGWPGASAAVDQRNHAAEMARQKNTFNSWLIQHGGKVYDSAKVDAYMGDIVENLNNGVEQFSWGWFPVAGQVWMSDIAEVQLSGIMNDGSRVFKYRNFKDGNWYTTQPFLDRPGVQFTHIVNQQLRTDYIAPIPENVLQQMAAIKDEFPCAEFDVTAVTRKADPFLRVRFDWGSEVIAKWDEPGFKD